MREGPDVPETESFQSDQSPLTSWGRSGIRTVGMGWSGEATAMRVRRALTAGSATVRRVRSVSSPGGAKTMPAWRWPSGHLRSKPCMPRVTSPPRALIAETTRCSVSAGRGEWR